MSRGTLRLAAATATTESSAADKIVVGHPAPWFDGRTLAGASVSLGVLAGRWIVLCFLDRLGDRHASPVLVDLISDADLFRDGHDDHIVCYAVIAEPPQAAEQLAPISHSALGFIADRSGAISRAYHAMGAPRVVVLNPLLQVVANFPLGADGTPSTLIRRFLHDLPAVDDFTGIGITAPILVVPHVFERAFCDRLIELHEAHGGIESGFLLDQNGKTSTFVDRDLKSRRDFVLTDPEMREAIRERVVQRLLPMIERFLQFSPTRMDRYMVSCYDAASRGHFSAHRDNVNLGARHRRFAVSINLNLDYDGGDLMFPEFGRRRYRAPHGGAVVFSTGTLHQVTPMTRGRRYAFVPFLYDEADSRQRLANNVFLSDSDQSYTGEQDRLFPERFDQ